MVWSDSRVRVSNSTTIRSQAKQTNLKNMVSTREVRTIRDWKSNEPQCIRDNTPRLKICIQYSTKLRRLKSDVDVIVTNYVTEMIESKCYYNNVILFRIEKMAAPLIYSLFVETIRWITKKLCTKMNHMKCN